MVHPRQFTYSAGAAMLAMGVAVLLAAAVVLADSAPSSRLTGGGELRGYLGVRVIDPPTVGTRGAYVFEVLPGGAAADVGLKSDDLIVRYNATVVDSPQKLMKAGARATVGDRVELQIMRAGKEKDVAVTLKEITLEMVLAQRNPPRARGGVIAMGTRGAGSVGNIENTGNLDIMGHVVVEGFYKQAAIALLHCSAGPTERSILKVSGPVRLDGVLHVTFDNCEPKAGDHWELISNAKSIKGRFRWLIVPPLPGGLKWDIVYDDLARTVDLDRDGKYDVTLVIQSPVNR